MLKQFKNFTKKDWLFIFISIFLIVGQVSLELKMPDYMSEITKLVQTEGSKMGDILLNGGYMLLCAFGSLVLAFFTGFLVSKVSSNFSKNIRKKLFDKVETLAIQDVKKFSDDRDVFVMQKIQCKQLKQQQSQGKSNLYIDYYP